MASSNKEEENASFILLVRQGRHFKSSKNESSTTTILRCETQDQQTLGEVTIFNVDAEGTVGIDFAQEIFIGSNVEAWNKAANKPVLLSLFESSRKKKSSPTTRVGVAVIDIMHLMFDPSSTSHWVKLFPSDNQIPDIDRDLSQYPEVFVEYEGEFPLLPEDTRLLTFTIDAFYGLPECSSNDRESHSFATGFGLPLGLSTSDAVTISRGFCSDSLPRWRRRCWSSSKGLSGEEDFIPSKGEFHHSAKFSEIAEGEGVDLKYTEEGWPRIIVNTEHRIIFCKEHKKKLEDYITNKKYMVVELLIKKTKQSQSSTKKRNKKFTDEQSSKQYGMCQILLDRFIQPGVTTLSGAYPISPLDPTFCQKITGKCSVLLHGKVGLTEELMKRTVQSNPGRGTVAMESQAGFKSAAQSAVVVDSDQSCDDGVFSIGSVFLVLHIALSKPLIEKSTSQHFSLDIDSLLQPYPKYDNHDVQIQDAVELYQNVIIDLSKMILSQIKSTNLQFGKGDTLFREKLTAEFSVSAKYSEIRERMFTAMVKLVRQNCLRICSVDDKKEWHNYTNIVYVYLVNQADKIIRASSTPVDPHPEKKKTDKIPPSKEYAEEAHLFQYMCKARKYYLDRIADSTESVSRWLDFGQYSLATNDTDTAEQCFRKVLSMDAKHPMSILLLSVVLSMQGKISDAYALAEYVCSLRPNCFICPAVIATILERDNDLLAAKISYKSAEDLLRKAIRLNTITSLMEFGDVHYGNNAKWDESHADSDESKNMHSSIRRNTVDGTDVFDIIVQHNYVAYKDSAKISDKDIQTNLFLLVSKFLTKCKSFHFAEHIISKIPLTSTNKAPIEYYQTAAFIKFYQHDLEAASDIVDEALTVHCCDSTLLFIRGLAHYQRGEARYTKHCFLRLLNTPTNTVSERLLHLYLGVINYNQEDFQDAWKHLTNVIQIQPSPVSYLWLGKTLYRLDRFIEAQEALTHANALDSHCSESWAFLTMIAIKNDHLEIAEEAFKHVSDREELDEELRNELNSMCLGAGLVNEKMH